MLTGPSQKADRFTIQIGKEVLADLRRRLTHTHWPTEFAGGTWEDGADLQYLKSLVHYWSTAFDWRAQEREINKFAHFRVVLDEVPIHFIYERGQGPSPIPLILNHGWPWTFWDFQKIIRPLTHPASYGASETDAFDVIVPSLPGYGNSTPLSVPGIDFTRTADLWVRLLSEVLGYSRFAVQGGDWGAMVVAQLGHKYAESVIGIHVHMLAPLDAISGQFPIESEYGADERIWIEENREFMARETGCWAMQATKPQTLAYALQDSPVGLCAWIIEKRRAWSDCKGDIEARFSKDDLLTTVMIYWATQCFNTSARYYYEAAHNPWRPAHDRWPVVAAPTGVALFPKENLKMRHRWANKYYNLHRWTVMPSGGHFAPTEEPEMLVADIRAFFRALRPGAN